MASKAKARAETTTRKTAAKPKQPREQSGSTGRRAATGGNDGKDTGQGRYGQTGVAGKQTETDGQANYRESASRGSAANKTRSNKGSGRADRDETKTKR
jgi:hypothetical protein